MNKLKFVSFTAGLVLAMAFTLSCSGDGGGPNDPAGTKTPLSTPANVRVDAADFTLKWDAVPEAEAYAVDIDGTTETVIATQFPLKRLTSDPKIYTLKVRALAASGSTMRDNSAFSAPLPCEPAAYVFTYEDGIQAQSRLALKSINLAAGSGLTITGLTAFGKTLADIVIPEQIGNGAVTVIGSGAFENVAIVSVVIPATVAEIGGNAFKGTAIVAVVIPESVTSIGSGAFSEIATLTEVVFERGAENGATELGSGVFNGSAALETIIVPEGSANVYEEKIAESSPDAAGKVDDNGSQPTSFAITVNAGNGGTIRTSSSGSAVAGDTVYIIVTPDQGYQMSGLRLTRADGNAINAQAIDTAAWWFTMPASAVTVSGTFVVGGGNSSSSGGGSSSSVDSGGNSSSSGGGSSSSVGSGYVPVGRGNNISSYRTVKIGGQTWMAENLDYTVAGSRCYGDDQANCDEYGQLYDWAVAMALPSSCNENSCSDQINSPHQGICPSGWHIPSDDDWDELRLRLVVGGSSTAGIYLKAKSGWYDCGPSGSDNSYQCEDAYGFSALPGGQGYSDGSFDRVGNYGYWWIASEYDSYAGHGTMSYDSERAFFGNDYRSNLFSVRCLQD